MKKILIICVLITAFSRVAFAQRFAYVDMQYILNNIPEYADAQKKLDAQSSAWQKEIQDKNDAIDKMNKDYQGQQVLMSDDMKKQKQQDIADKEREVKELQKQYFGYDGQLFKLREQLVKPIQDKVYDAIQKVAASKSYDFIFDKSVSVYIMYANPKMDVSDQVLTLLGYTPKVNASTTNKTNQGQSQGQQQGQQAPSVPGPTPGHAVPLNQQQQNNSNIPH